MFHARRHHPSTEEREEGNDVETRHGMASEGTTHWLGVGAQEGCPLTRSPPYQRRCLLLGWRGCLLPPPRFQPGPQEGRLLRPPSTVVGSELESETRREGLERRGSPGYGTVVDAITVRMQRGPIRISWGRGVRFGPSMPRRSSILPRPSHQPPSWDDKGVKEEDKP